MKLRDKSISTVCGILVIATLAVAQSTSNLTSSGAVPRLVKYSGTVKDDAGHAKIGVVGVTFALYKDQDGGAPLWMEIQNVQADVNGRYTALLGSTKADGLPADLFTSNEAQWLGVQVEGQAEQPRILFVSVPYALKAADAETIGGLPPTAFVRAAEPGTAGSSTSQTSSSSTSRTSSSPVTPASTLNVITASPGDTPGFLPLWTGASPTHSVESSVLFQSGSKLVGINTKNPGASLEVDSNNQLGLFVNAPFTGVGSGLDLHTTGSGGKGWEILATGSTAAQGPSKLNIRDLSSAADIFTIAPGGLVGIGNTNPGTVLQVTDHNLTGTTVGTVFAADAFKVGTAIFGDATATSGLTQGVFGQIFSSTTASAAVLGEAHSTTGQTYGVQGYNFSTGTFSTGVSGVSSSSSGVTFGVIGTSTSPNGTGLLGLGQGQSNTGRGIGCCVVGIWGDTNSSAPGAAGLVGTADDARAIYLENNSPSGVPTAFMQQDAAGQFALVAGGAGGFCTIDTNGALFCPGGTSTVAPVDSGRRQVALYSVQSPQNWFEDFGSGELTGGAATIGLDRTFAQTVNASSDYHVFLTPQGDCRGLYVTRKTPTGFDVRELGGGRSTVAFEYRIVALRRGSESVRLADMTERSKKANAPLPNSGGKRFTIPVRPPAPNVSGRSEALTSANLGIPR